LAFTAIANINTFSDEDVVDMGSRRELFVDQFPVGELKDE
jgi:hypothetical protein